MPDAHSLLLFMTAALALDLTPGPDVLYADARGAGEGGASGVAFIGLGARIALAGRR